MKQEAYRHFQVIETLANGLWQYDVFPTKARLSYQRCILKIREDEKKCFHFIEWQSKYINGLLHGIEELIFTGDPTGERKIPCISLPIVSGDNLLPGAPRAAYNGFAVLCSTNVDTMGYYNHLTEKAKQEAKWFFENDGKHIKSVVSMRIPSIIDDTQNQEERRPFGILNIDCNQEYMIGNEEDGYYFTYLALVRPIVESLGQYFEDYCKKYKEILLAEA